jgi:hypothetical protein
LRSPGRRADLPFIARLYAQGCQRSLVACEWDEALWRYELNGKSARNVNRYELRLIEHRGADGTPGEPVGFLAHPPFSWGDLMPVLRYELAAGLSWAAVTPSVIRYLEAAYADLSIEPPGSTQPAEKKPLGAFGFMLGEQHPAYQVMVNRLPHLHPPYAWYIRLPDLPGFLCHIAPVLEQRLAASPLVGYSGELKVTFYRSGLRLVFEQGRLALCKAWQPERRAIPATRPSPT